ncbi:hypothetical protein [Neokomagataea thailandica]|uniref:hypothetical protein n=1 Tax=Neokomagataea TaxID=1223423 RepID=UPI0008305066|nr:MULTISPECIES: hypothetical protein [Neokomagataea]
MKYAKNIVNHSKRQRITLYTFIFTIALIILGDTVCWLLAQHTLSIQAENLIQNATQAGWHIEHAPPYAGEWPFGATLTFPIIHATYQTSDKTLTLVWHGEGAQLGAYWPAFIRHPHALHLIGNHAARALLNNQSVTLLTRDATLTPSDSNTHLAFSAPILSIGINASNFTHSITSTAPKLTLMLPGTTPPLTFGVMVESPAILTDSASFSRLTHVSLAVTSTAPSAHDALYNSNIRLPLASMTITTPIGNIPFTAAGTLQRPSMNGSFTLTFPHWRQTAQNLTAAEHPFLDPALQQKLHTFFFTPPPNTNLAENPLSFQLRILNGQLEPNFPEFFRQISTRKIDATNEGE